jgi:hypothetical protein
MRRDGGQASSCCLAFLHQFVDPADPVIPQMLVLGTLLVCLGVLSDGAYALLAAGAGNRLRATAAARRTLDPHQRRGVRGAWARGRARRRTAPRRPVSG